MCRCRQTQSASRRSMLIEDRPPPSHPPTVENEEEETFASPEYIGEEGGGGEAGGKIHLGKRGRVVYERLSLFPPFPASLGRSVPRGDIPPPLRPAPPRAGNAFSRGETNIRDLRFTSLRLR